MVYSQSNEVFDKIIHLETNVHLHFDIDDIGQPFHRRRDIKMLFLMYLLV